MRFSSFVLIALLAGFSLLYSCRKDERIEPKNTVSELKERFFNDHPSSDPLVQSLRQFFLSEDEDHNIVEKIVARIGFPHWDKSISISNSSNSDKVTNEPETLTYIPFVVDSQHFVNAALLIKTTPADTNYKFLCNWQYDQYGYDTSAAEWNARNVFHLFTQLDKSVFNITRFRIKDENLLTTEQKEYLTNMGLSFDSVEIIYTFKPFDSLAGRNNIYTIVTTCNIVDVCIGQQFATRHSKSTSMAPPCVVMTFSICTNAWVDIPGGGGSGGGGNSGGGTPPECEGGLPPTRSSLYQNPCEPGWIPVEDDYLTLEQLLQQWDDAIIVHSSVRPCINAIIDQVKNIKSGAIADMIYQLSSQIPSFNWEIKEVQQLPAPYDNANALTTTNLYYPYATTELNQAILGNATNITLARTILHEAVHAFIQNFINNQNQLSQAEKDQILAFPFAKKLKSFIKIKYNSPDYDNVFHNLMVTNFHNDIRDALKELCPVMGINLPEAELNLICSDLAWGGLQSNESDSPWMDPNILTGEDRARIIKRLDVELNNLPGFTGYVSEGSGPGYYVSLTRAGTKACP